MKLLAAFMIVFIGSGVLPARACKCDALPSPTIDESLQQSDIIFIGRCSAGETRKDPQDSTRIPSSIRYEFEVYKVIKGKELQESVTIETGIGFGDCGYPFRLGVSYLVYGVSFGGQFTTNVCTRTKEARFYHIGLIDDAVEKEISELMEKLE